MHRYKHTRVAVVLAAVFYLAACQYLPAGLRGTPEPIVFGTLAHEYSGLMYIAQDQGYFAANGLAITFRTYDTGVETSGAALAGEVDLAGCAEFVLVGRAFANDPLRTIATIAKSEDQYIVARSDRGVSDVPDLAGKQIGVPHKTVSEFYLGRFLDLHGMNIQQVHTVDLTPAEIVTAITDGRVDAAALWDPFASQVRKQLPDRTQIWPAQSSQVLYWNIVATDAWIGQHRGTVTRLLSALAQAEAFTRAHPDQAKAIIREALRYEDAAPDDFLVAHHYALSLDQSLILAMEDEARWMINNGLAPDAKVPDFLRNVYLDGLMAVKPGAVNIIH